MSAQEKEKLATIEAGAGAPTTIIDNLTSQNIGAALSANQGYVLKGLIDGKASSSHSHSISNVSGLQSALDGKASSSHIHTPATSTSNGFMSSSDKVKLDGISNNATETYVIDELSSTSSTRALSANQGRLLKGMIDEKAPSIHAHTNATTSSAGFMSSSDKAKLNGIEAGATNTALTDKYNGYSAGIALSQYGGYSLFSDLKLRGNITHTSNSGQYINQWIETTVASTTNASVLSSGQSISIALNTGGYMPTDTIFLSSTLTNYHGVYLDNIKRTGGYTISARVINISGASFNNLERCEWNILYSYQRS